MHKTQTEEAEPEENQRVNLTEDKIPESEVQNNE
jgi:hypothetical protein